MSQPADREAPSGAASGLSTSARRVQEAIRALGFSNEVFELERPVRTAADAARALGCQVAQIAKSVIFRGVQSGRPVLVVTSGSNRVNEQRIEALLGEPIGKADPDFVREHTGFAIGGVPPLGHTRSLEIFVDQDLMKLDAIWAAAGHPNSLFRVGPQDLARMAGGRIVQVT